MGFQAYHVLDLFHDTFRLRAGQIDLIDDRDHIQVMVQRQIHIGKGLRLDALGRIHHQNRAVTGGKGTADLVVKIHMAGRVYQIQDILLPVLRPVHRADRLGLDCNAPLPLQVHIVQHLCLHLPAGQEAGMLDNPVRQGGFAVVNMGHNAEIADSGLFCIFYGFHSYPSLLHINMAPVSAGRFRGSPPYPPAPVHLPFALRRHTRCPVTDIGYQD